jgi:sugar O-acyltransferase (sialic acid O-acetyltransferase NeuD family)
METIFLGASALPETIHVFNSHFRESNSAKIVAILDDNESLHGTEVCGVPVVGPLSLASEFPDEVNFIFGIGSHRSRLIRSNIIERIGIEETRYISIIHETANVLPGAQIGHGCIIHPGVIVGQDSRLDGFNLVFTNSIVASRNHLHKFSMVTSLVALTDGVEIGQGAFIGTGSAVGEGVRVGPGALVGMGSVILKDVPPGVCLVGNPPKPFGRVNVPNDLVNAWNSV